MCSWTTLDWTQLVTWAGVLINMIVGYFMYSVTKQTREIYDYLAHQADRNIAPSQK